MFITKIGQIPALAEREDLREVVSRYPLKVSSYYLDLIDVHDPRDPLARIVLPHQDEFWEWEWGSIDPSKEREYTVLEGLQHKYDSTVLMLISNQCAGLCRYCFRKRLFINKKSPEVLKDLDAALRYIKEHPDITNVILSGGDALMLSTPKLREILARLREIQHVHIIRLGTKVPAYLPQRIISDQDLLNLIQESSWPTKKIYIMAHFDHPRELTPLAIQACHSLMRCGAVVVNQTPLIRGVNDDPQVLGELFKKLSFYGIAPYYVFQCRPALGNRPYVVPIEEGYQIFEAARGLCSGLAKRARFTMSHFLGKLEILALTEEQIIFKFHRAADNRNTGKILVYERNPEAYWLDDYAKPLAVHPLAYDTLFPSIYV